MWGALKSTASLLKSTLYDKFGGSLILKHNCKINEFSMQIIRGTHAPFTKTYKKGWIFLNVGKFGRYHMSLSFFVFLAAESLKPSKSNDHKQLPKHQSRHYDHLFLPALGKNISINWLARQSLNLKGYSLWRPLPRGFPNRWGFGPDELCSDSWFFGHPWITKYARSRFGIEFPQGFGVKHPNKSTYSVGCSSKLDDSSRQQGAPKPYPIYPAKFPPAHPILVWRILLAPKKSGV